MPFAKLLLALIVGMASCGLAGTADIRGSLVDGCAASLQGEINHGDCPDYGAAVPAYYSLPPNTGIADLPPAQP